MAKDGRLPRRCPECHESAPNVTAIGDAEDTWVCGQHDCSVREFTRDGVKTRMLPRERTRMGSTSPSVPEQARRQYGARWQNA